MLNKLIAALFLLATPAMATVLEIDSKRVTTISGMIDEYSIGHAKKLLAFSRKDPKKPVYMLINSPGGGVLAGLQIINIMNIVKQRGTTIHCVVPMIAMSMAFQIFAECDKRYVFDYSMLLWHPIRVQMQGYLTPRDAVRLAKNMRLYEKVMVDQLIKTMVIEKKLFYYHYYEETIHLGVNLKTLVPTFLEVIVDIKGVRIPFTMGR